MNSRTESNPTQSPTVVEAERAFGEIEMGNLSSISRVLAIWFAALGLADLALLPRAIGIPLFVMSLLLAFGFTAVAGYVNRVKLSTRRLIWANGIVALAASVGAMVSMHVIAQPAQIVGACLLLVGLGVFVNSLRWYVLVMGVTVLGWLALVWRAGATPEWLTTLFLLGGAVVLSICVFILRQRNMRDLEQTRLQQKQQKEHLERMLREQERIQGELRETETRYRTLVEQLPAATYVDALDPNSSTLYISPQIERITGYTTAEWMTDGGLWGKLLAPQDYDETMEALRRHQESGERLRVEYRLIARDGRVVWIHDEAALVKDARGTPLYSQGYMTDITERKEREEALRRRDAIFETVRYAAEAFLRAPSWQDRIGRVLARLGTATQVDYVYLAENATTNDGIQRQRLRYEWHAPGGLAQIENARMDMSLRALQPERWDLALGMGIPVYGDVTDFPAEERELLDRQGIRSLAVIPVFVGRAWWGVIGFQVPDRAHTWASTELDALQAAANTLGAAIQRHRDEREVAGARDLALEALRLKSEFLAMMSHEIRTPMNTIVGMSELLLESPLNADQREYASSVRHASDVLLTIINDILDFSKIEAGRFTLEPVAFHLGDLIAGTVELLAPTAREKGLDMHLDLGNEVPLELIGDAVRLRQVLINLLSNAIKFTERGKVVVHVGMDADAPEAQPPEPGRVRIAFAVSDTGIGISPETRARLFQPFMQGDMSITRRYGGTGLGLAISRRLVELMGGEIDVESVEGQGSVFRFSVPIQLQAVREGEPGSIQPEPLAPERLRGAVLLAEDNAAIQKLTQLQLQLLGVREVETVTTGVAAVNAIQNVGSGDTTYMLVLMDCQMPEMDGFAAARAIRELEQGTERHVPIVALTARALDGDGKACLAAGMDDYIAKPLRLEALRTTLDRWLPTSNGSAVPPKNVDRAPVREPPRADTGSMDFHILNTLRSLEDSDNPNDTRELVQAYLEETTARLELLATVLAKQELTQAHMLAHSIRGSSVSLGAVRLADLAGEIEKCAQERDMSCALERLPVLRKEFERVQAALKAEAFVS